VIHDRDQVTAVSWCGRCDPANLALRQWRRAVL